MKAGLMITTVLALVLASGCVSLNTPDGYAERDQTGRYDYKAISTDASVISVTVQRNEDKKKGTLPYWTEASRKHMTLSRGYEFKEEGEFLSPQGKGRWMLFSRKYRGTDYLYVLGLVVDGRKIYVLEAGGELEFFENDVPKVVQAFATLD
jgi:hypothetical protein